MLFRRTRMSTWRAQSDGNEHVLSVSIRWSIVPFFLACVYVLKVESFTKLNQQGKGWMGGWIDGSGNGQNLTQGGGEATNGGCYLRDRITVVSVIPEAHWTVSVDVTEIIYVQLTNANNMWPCYWLCRLLTRGWVYEEVCKHWLTLAQSGICCVPCWFGVWFWFMNGTFNNTQICLSSAREWLPTDGL